MPIKSRKFNTSITTSVIGLTPKGDSKGPLVIFARILHKVSCPNYLLLPPQGCITQRKQNCHLFSKS